MSSTPSSKPLKKKPQQRPSYTKRSNHREANSSRVSTTRIDSQVQKNTTLKSRETNVRADAKRALSMRRASSFKPRQKSTRRNHYHHHHHHLHLHNRQHSQRRACLGSPLDSRNQQRRSQLIGLEKRDFRTPSRSLMTSTKQAPRFRLNLLDSTRMTRSKNTHPSPANLLACRSKTRMQRVMIQRRRNSLRKTSSISLMS